MTLFIDSPLVSSVDDIAASDSASELFSRSVTVLSELKTFILIIVDFSYVLFIVLGAPIHFTTAVQSVNVDMDLFNDVIRKISPLDNSFVQLQVSKEDLIDKTVMVYSSNDVFRIERNDTEQV